MARAFFHENVPAAALKEIGEGTVSFEAPLITLAPGDHILELFNGPSLAFKDFGARFVVRHPPFPRPPAFAKATAGRPVRLGQA